MALGDNFDSTKAYTIIASSFDLEINYLNCKALVENFKLSFLDVP